jgi:hypothetical protein
MDQIAKHLVGVLRGGEDGPAGAAGNMVSFAEGRMLKQGETIYDLVDVVEEGNIPSDNDAQEVIVIDGKVYQRLRQPNDTLNRSAEIGRYEISAAVEEIAERVAREIIPGIAERIIREEIEKLKE